MRITDINKRVTHFRDYVYKFRDRANQYNFQTFQAMIAGHYVVPQGERGNFIPSVYLLRGLYNSSAYNYTCTPIMALITTKSVVYLLQAHGGFM